MRFGGDWTGLFLRGDDAYNYAVALEEVLGEDRVRTPARLVLRGLLADLKSVDDRLGRDREGVTKARLEELFRITARALTVIEANKKKKTE